MSIHQITNKLISFQYGDFLSKSIYFVPLFWKLDNPNYQNIHQGISCLTLKCMLFSYLSSVVNNQHQNWQRNNLIIQNHETLGKRVIRKLSRSHLSQDFLVFWFSCSLKLSSNDEIFTKKRWCPMVCANPIAEICPITPTVVTDSITNEGSSYCGAVTWERENVSQKIPLENSGPGCHLEETMESSELNVELPGSHPVVTRESPGSHPGVRKVY